MSTDSSMSISAIRVSQPIGNYFIARMGWKILEQITYSDVRRIEERDVEKYLGIQRPLSQKRVKDIANYIYNSKDATFPTSIIIAIDEKCAEYDEGSATLTLNSFLAVEEEYEDDIPKQRIAKVIDGQHRIAGFTEMETKYGLGSSMEFELNVAIFIGIDLPEQAKIFATVNLAQTKVNKSLVYDLEDLARSRSPHKTCHHIAVALDSNEKSPFFERIKRLGVRTPGRDYEPLTQAAFVESLSRLISADPTKDRNDLMARKRLEKIDDSRFPFRTFFERGTTQGDLVIYDIVYNYFKAVQTKWPNAWGGVHIKGNLLPRSNAFKALMNFLKDSAYFEASEHTEGDVPSINAFLDTLSRADLKDQDFTTKVFVPGSSGQAMFYKVLSGELKASQLISDE